MAKQKRTPTPSLQIDETNELKPSLVVLYSGLSETPERGRRYPLLKKVVTIGTGEQADIQLPPGSAAPRHAQLRLVENEWHIFDLTQDNGLVIKGLPVKTYCFYRDGEVFHVGRARIKFLSGQGEESLCFAEMYRRDITDFLTNTYNKDFFQKHLLREVVRALRYKRKLSLVVIDLDKFGIVNKTYGQLTGDAVLKQAAQCMKDSIREADILGRVGGEEFAVIFPETELDEARELAERLRQNLEDLVCEYENYILRTTMSAGVVQLKGETNYNKFFEKANQLMRSAKKNGRNRVEG